MQYLTWLGALFIIWVILQYVFIGSNRAIPITKHIKIHINEFKQHDVVMVRHQQLPFVLIHRTPAQLDMLKVKYGDNHPLRSIRNEYFIALAIGTDFGCIVASYRDNQLKETCSGALYDYSGRSISGKNEALIVPQMTYNKDNQFFNLTMK